MSASSREIAEPTHGWFDYPDRPSMIGHWDGSRWTELIEPPTNWPELPGPGWYRFPDDDRYERYWNGLGWDSELREPAGSPADGDVVNLEVVPQPVAHAPEPDIGSQTQRADSSRSLGDTALRAVYELSGHGLLRRQTNRWFFLPELTALVQADPRDPRHLVWLGLRIREAHAFHDALRRSIRGPVGWALSPIFRALFSTGDPLAASNRVLGAAYERISRQLHASPRPDAGLLSLLARIQYAAGQDVAIQTAHRATTIAPTDGAVSFTYAELLFKAGHEEEALSVADHANSLGCTLAMSILDPKRRAARRRLDWPQVNWINPRFHDEHWVIAIAAWGPVDRGQLRAHLGPSLLTDHRSKSGEGQTLEDFRGLR